MAAQIDQIEKKRRAFLEYIKCLKIVMKHLGIYQVNEGI